MFRKPGPEYTVRMLLSETVSGVSAVEVKEDKENSKVPVLKKFSHFTLGCTSKDETVKVSEALEKLAEFFKKPVTFTAEEAVDLNLNTKEEPLWAVRLNLGEKEEDVRAIFAEQFDSIMCAEQNGTLYQWSSKEDKTKKCPHITIGKTKADEEIANQLVNMKCKFTFNQIDYKRVGPHDPTIFKKLEPVREKVPSPV